MPSKNFTARLNPNLVRLAEAEKGQPLACIHEVISGQARLQPRALAAVDDHESITYGELERRSDQFAAYLRRHGIEADVLVGLAMPPIVELLVGMLAILKAGGAYVPLDPTYPRQRLEFMLADAAPKLVVTTESIAAKLPTGALPVCRLDQLGKKLLRETPVDFQQTSKPVDLAYVIYTSGSTGKPKGVLLEHGGLRDMALFHAKQFSLGPGSHFLQFASVCFDASVLEIFCALAAGATLHLTDSTNRLPGQPLVETLQQRKISHVLLPPSTLAVLPDAELPDLKTLISGGEPCTAALVDRWARGRQLINAYGPTETTVTATTWCCQHGDRDTPPIGRACAETTLYVLDEENRPVPPGQSGELHIGGSGVARGYLNLPELTQAQFLPDLFSQQAGARLYKSGDIVCQRDDGALEFLGRLDRQIKTRGFRIELGEIEACLQEHPDIEQAVVQVIQQPDSHDSMTAYYIVVGNGVAKSHTQLDESTLRGWLQKQLPAYMLPARYVAVDQLPPNEAGKVEVSRLPQPVRLDGLGNLPPPSSQAAALAKIWADVLGFENVGMQEHFIELGGDSLLSVRIAEQARQQGIEISAQDILSYPTIGELMELMARDEA